VSLPVPSKRVTVLHQNVTGRDGTKCSGTALFRHLARAIRSIELAESEDEAERRSYCAAGCDDPCARRTAVSPI